MKKVAVLKGGWSPERPISLLSGENISNLFRDIGWEVHEIDVIKDLKFITSELYRINPDFIYNALHGIGGEDGVMQGVLEIFGKPYAGAGVLSSAVCFDKSIAKKLFKVAGIRTPDGIEMTFQKLKNLTDLPLPYPFVLKPCANGSSVGVFIVHSYDDLEKIKKMNWSYGDEILIEQYIPGREFTVLVANGKPIGSLEITAKHEFYDYESKYDEDGSVHDSEYSLQEEIKREMFEMSAKAYKVCKCRGWVRADFRFDGKDLYILELNTRPGITKLSLVPDIAKYSGIPTKKLLEIE